MVGRTRILLKRSSHRGRTRTSHPQVGLKSGLNHKHRILVRDYKHHINAVNHLEVEVTEERSQRALA